MDKKHRGFKKNHRTDLKVKRLIFLVVFISIFFVILGKIYYYFYWEIPFWDCFFDGIFSVSIIIFIALFCVRILKREKTKMRWVDGTATGEEEKYKTIFNLSPEAIIVLDRKGKMIDLNGKIYDWLGYKREEVLGKNLLNLPFLDRKNKSIVIKKFMQRMIGKNVSSYDLEFIDKKNRKHIGRIRANPIKDENRKITGDLIFIEDVTLTRESEERLKTSKENIEKEKAKDEAIMENIAEGMIVTDEKGIILFFNKAAEELLGWRSREIIGKDLIRKIKIVDANGKKFFDAKRPFQMALSGKKNLFGGVTQQYYYCRKDKSKFPVAIIVSPVIWEGKIIGTVEVFRDITREKEVDKAKTEFVSMASHQLRTPLVTMNWYIEMLLGREVGNITKAQEDYLKNVYNASQRMTELVSALLNVTRIEFGAFAIEPKKVDIKKIANSVIEELLPKVQKKKIRIKKDFQKDLPFISTDPKLTRIILQNLFSNAVKYTKVNRGRIVISIKKQKDNILIKVLDNGYGIPEKEQNKIFTKLFRADNIKVIEPDGTGLGLYIAKGIVDGYGGNIWFESEQNKKTVFSATIPIKIKRKAGSKKITILKT